MNSTFRVCAFAGLLVMFGLPAQADLVTALSVSPVTAPVNLTFTNVTDLRGAGGAGSLRVGTIDGPYNFLDRWTFTLASGAELGGLVSSINSVSGGGVLRGIDNLQMSLTGPGNVPIVVGSQTVRDSGGIQILSSTISPTLFAPGNYSVDVRGTLIGAGSTRYSGTLQVIAPVPVPAALPLLALGLAGLVATGRRRPKV